MTTFLNHCGHVGVLADLGAVAATDEEIHSNPGSSAPLVPLHPVWVKCSDQLPDDQMESYWVYVNDKFLKTKFIEVDYWIGNSWTRFPDTIIDMEVTHWLPYYTPEPPKE